MSQQNSLSSSHCTGLQGWFTESIVIEASSAPQFSIAGTASPSVKDIVIVKAMLSIPGETEKNVQGEMVIVSDEGEKQKRGNDSCPLRQHSKSD